VNCEDLELSLTFMSKAGGETLKGILLVFLANVGLGWIGWPGRSALAYLDSLSAKKKKDLITSRPGANVKKLFMFVIYGCL
jgi:hypothetical protein